MRRGLRKPLALSLSLAALAAVPVPPAMASLTWIVRGHGFGHGVGMSQYGAYGYALHGKGLRFILAHYYSGTTIGTLTSNRTVRVLLEESGGDVGFSGASSACGRALSPSRDYVAHPAGSSVKLRTSSGMPLADCGHELRAGGGTAVRIAGLGAYRGALDVVARRGSANVVNALNVNQYVKGVIPNESPSSWPMAELRAQAVASRSFALSAGVNGDGFNLYSTSASQVYKGLESETQRTNLAAESTRGQVVMYRGRIAEAFFSTCSGGHTESVQNVFGGPPLPYLIGVPDPYDYYCPLHNWELRFSGPQISARLGSYLNGRLKQIVVTKRGASPRILSARLYGTRGPTPISGEQLETALGAYSTWMRFERIG
jgi:stage II sporulation protein D